MQITEEQRNTEKQMKAILSRIRAEFQSTVLLPGEARTGHPAARSTLRRQCQQQLKLFVPVHRALRAYMQPSHSPETQRCSARVYAKHCSKLVEQLQRLWRRMGGTLEFPDLGDVQLYVRNDLGFLVLGLTVSATLADEAAKYEAAVLEADTRRGDLLRARFAVQRKEEEIRQELWQSFTEAQLELLKKLGPDGQIILKATRPL